MTTSISVFEHSAELGVDAPPSTFASRHRGYTLRTVAALCLSASVICPAFAYDSATLVEQTRRVDEVLQPLFTYDPPDGHAWTWYGMAERCTKELMLTSLEQNPDIVNVRCTERALNQLVNCAISKGFKPKPGVVIRK